MHFEPPSEHYSLFNSSFAIVHALVHIFTLFSWFIDFTGHTAGLKTLQGQYDAYIYL